uniref:Uncharacterized protein n=1 Tax=Prolemur simus TaxID=1328070 RepID=A0A8C8ZZL0_PROSS
LELLTSSDPPKHTGHASGSALAVPPVWSEALKLKLCTAPQLVGLARGAEGQSSSFQSPSQLHLLSS